MANNKEEAGKGTPRPGEMPGSKRTYATIDLTASEVPGKDKQPAPAAAATAASAASAASASESKSQAKPESKASDAQAKAAGGEGRPGSQDKNKPAVAATPIAARALAAPWLSHLAAGALGAIVVLIATELMRPERPPAQSPEISDLTRRMADMEGALGMRPGAGLRARVEEMGRSIGAIGETQAKLARETKALDAKVGTTPEFPPELMGRLAKLEDALGAASAADPATQSPQVVALAGKLSELEKSARNATELARTGIARFDGELATVRTDAGRVAQRLDTLKGEIEERLKGAAKVTDLAPISTAVATLERDVQTFLKGEAERTASATANASQMLLGLELANLKRAIDRGDGYTEELARAKRVGGATINFAPLERYMKEGAAAHQDLAKSFRKASDAMLDAEVETPNASLMDRFWSGARSVVRVRKSGYAADDVSVEAVVARMEAGVKDGRLGDVLANAKKLPPKAALAGEDWIRKVEARQAVDQALADVEAQLKTSLGAAKPAASEGKR